jgi:hypothetical protein
MHDKLEHNSVYLRRFFLNFPEMFCFWVYSKKHQTFRQAIGKNYTIGFVFFVARRAAPRAANVFVFHIARVR